MPDFHTHSPMSTNTHKQANTIWCLVLIYDPRHNRDKSGTFSQKMFDCILELPPITAAASWKIYFCSGHQVHQSTPSSLHSLPLSLTLDIFRSEHRLVAMATIINTSGIVIWHAHAHRAERGHTWTHVRTCVHTHNKQHTYVKSINMHRCAATFSASWLQSGACVGEITGWGLLGKIHQRRTFGLSDNPIGEFNPTSFILIRWEMELMLSGIEFS